MYNGCTADWNFTAPTATTTIAIINHTRTHTHIIIAKSVMYYKNNIIMLYVQYNTQYDLLIRAYYISTKSKCGRLHEFYNMYSFMHNYSVVGPRFSTRLKILLSWLAPSRMAIAISINSSEIGWKYVVKMEYIAHKSIWLLCLLFLKLVNSVFRVVVVPFHFAVGCLAAFLIAAQAHLLTDKQFCLSCIR